LPRADRIWNTLLVREFKVDPKTLAEKGLKPTDDAKQFFTGLGVSFPEGATCSIRE
jgi:hypothetical protein